MPESSPIVVSDPIIAPHDDDEADVWYWNVICPDHGYYAWVQLEAEHLGLFYEQGVLEKFLEAERKYVVQKFLIEAECQHEVPPLPLPASTANG